jgi:hypothetical protein
VISHDYRAATFTKLRGSLFNSGSFTIWIAEAVVVLTFIVFVFILVSEISETIEKFLLEF